MLFASLWVLIIWGLIQLFIHPSPVTQTIYALLGALVFSGYIVYDTYLLIQRECNLPVTALRMQDVCLCMSAHCASGTTPRLRRVCFISGHS